MAELRAFSILQCRRHVEYNYSDDNTDHHLSKTSYVPGTVQSIYRIGIKLYKVGISISSISSILEAMIEAQRI